MSAQPAATMDGSQALYPPTEDQLWTQGPPINTPSQAPYTPTPNTQRELDYLHEAVHYPFQGNEANDLAVVNPWNDGPTGVGRYNNQPFQTAATVHCQPPQSSEQGWGVGPGRRWARFPVVEMPTPFRNALVRLRNGTLDENVEDVTYELAQERELSWQTVMQTGTHTVVQDLPASVPFVETISAAGNLYGGPAGGPTPIPGIDGPVYPLS